MDWQYEVQLSDREVIVVPTLDMRFLESAIRAAPMRHGSWWWKWRVKRRVIGLLRRAIARGRFRTVMR